jgi:hypothetical protein
MSLIKEARKLKPFKSTLESISSFLAPSSPVTYFPFLTEHRGRAAERKVVSTLASYLGGPEFKSRVRRADIMTKVFVVFLGFSRQMPG